MGLYAHGIQTLDDLFVHGLRDIFYTENAVAKALPRMIGKATSWDLKQGFETHLLETTHQIKRLEEVFALHGTEPRIVDCPAIDAIIGEMEGITSDIADKDVVDAALTAAAQAVEHYQITRYGTLATWAARLGQPDCAALLRRNLEEEEMADGRLSLLAQRGSDPRAVSL